MVVTQPLQSPPPPPKGDDMEQNAIIGSIQLSVRFKDAAFDIIIEGNAYNPTIVNDMTNRMRELMHVGFDTAIDNGWTFPDQDIDDDDEEDDTDGRQ